MKNPATDAPLEIRKMLKRYAGVNQWGKPLWRLCLAQNVRKLRGGIFHELEGGRTTMFGIAPNGQRYYVPIRDKVTSGYMEVPRYSGTGWIMERWMPPHMWGTKLDWEQRRGEDGTPMMGPFPSQGDYWLISGPFPKMPDWSDMECSIAQYEQADRQRPTDLAAAMKQFIRDEAAAEEKRLELYEKELHQMLVSELNPVLRSTSLEAQRYRNELNAMIGSRSHAQLL